MFRPWRTVLSLVVVAFAVWAAFNVRLGEFTFAQHMDRIGQTDEAEALLDGTRSVVDPMLQEATDRMLGEYIVAPTIDEADLAERAGPPAPPRTRDDGDSRLPRAR